VSGQDRRWNHNIHYYPLVLAAVPPGCQRVLDVGCGEGMLARQLARRVPHVVGIDQDAASIELARRQGPGGQIEFVRGDCLTHPFPPASFGLISCVVALHHMDAAAALARMSQLLAPGGSLVIVGVARSRLPDLPWDAAAVIASLGHRVTRGYWQHPSPTVWSPSHTYRQIRALAGETLPGVRYRRHLLWRVLPGLGRASVVGTAEAAWPSFVAGSRAGCSLAQACPLVEPAGSGLVPAPPPGPAQVVADGLPGAGDQVEDTLDLGDGQRDQARVFGWQLIGRGRRECQGAGAGAR